MCSPAAKSPYAGYRFPAEVISQAVWLYFRFPLSLRMVEEMIAARCIVVCHETIRQWALKGVVEAQQYRSTRQEGAQQQPKQHPRGRPSAPGSTVEDAVIVDEPTLPARAY